MKYNFSADRGEVLIHNLNEILYTIHHTLHNVQCTLQMHLLTKKNTHNADDIHETSTTIKSTKIIAYIAVFKCHERISLLYLVEANNKQQRTHTAIWPLCCSNKMLLVRTAISKRKKKHKKYTGETKTKQKRHMRCCIRLYFIIYLLNRI